MYRHLANLFSTTNTDQLQSFPYRTYDAGTSHPPWAKGKEKVLYNEFGFNDYDVHSNLKGGDGTPHHQQQRTRDCSRPRQSLPTEIVSLIITHLTFYRKTLYQCTLVTKQFYAIANALLWNELDFAKDINTDRFLASIASPLQHEQQQRLSILGRHIHSLYLKGPLWTDAHFLRLIPHLPQLNHLVILSAAGITDTSFQHLPYHCQHLTSLDLSSPHLTQRSFSAIGEHCHQLKELNWFAYGDHQLPEWLTYLKDCPLERLKLYLHFHPLNEQAISIIQTFHRLTTLDITTTLSDSVDGLLHSPPAAATTTTTPPWWPQLKNLTLSPCDALDDPTLVGFIKSHPHLQELDLCNAMALTDTSLDAMTMWLPKLTRLVINDNSNISHEAVRRLVCRCQRLVSLRFRQCPQISVVGIPELLLHFDDCWYNTAVLDQRVIFEIRAGGADIHVE